MALRVDVTSSSHQGADAVTKLLVNFESSPLAPPLQMPERRNGGRGCHLDRHLVLRLRFARSSLIWRAPFLRTAEKISEPRVLPDEGLVDASLPSLLLSRSLPSVASSSASTCVPAPVFATAPSWLASFFLRRRPRGLFLFALVPLALLAPPRLRWLRSRWLGLRLASFRSRRCPVLVARQARRLTGRFSFPAPHDESVDGEQLRLHRNEVRRG
jgi:hypothetical protein